MLLRFVEPVAVMLSPGVALDFRFGAGLLLLGEQTEMVATLGLGALFR